MWVKLHASASAVQLHAGAGEETVKAVRWVAIRHPKVVGEGAGVGFQVERKE